MAKQSKGTASVKTAYGKTLREHGLDVDSLPLEFTFTELELKNADDVRTAREFFADEKNNKILVSALNAREKAKARAKATTALFEKHGIEAPSAEEPNVIYKNLVRQFVNGKLSEEKAEQMALNSMRAMFGDDWTPDAE